MTTGNKEDRFDALDRQTVTDISTLLVDNFAGIKITLKTLARVLAKLEDKDAEEVFRELGNQWKREAELLIPEFLTSLEQREKDDDVFKG
ncbi:MAG: hypothetical protein GF419_09790 [Ignavibacteriales bacterium]|jgi:hypothetical protein|nr:hypothetical protein [Ignavibacteriales bacterium]